MDGHPPFCPKTQERFFKDDTSGVCYCHMERGNEWGLCEITPAEARFLARYQACAWFDRGHRYFRVALHRRGVSGQEEAYEKSNQCSWNAVAWRAWERQKTQSVKE